MNTTVVTMLLIVIHVLVCVLMCVLSRFGVLRVEGRLLPLCCWCRCGGRYACSCCMCVR